MDFALEAIDTQQGADAGRWLTITNLTGKPLLNALEEPIKLLVHGTDSDRYRLAFRKMNRIQSELAADDAEKDRKADDAEIVRRGRDASIMLISACISGWSGILDSKKKALTFADEGAVQLVREYPHVRDQVDAFVSNRANFTKASSGD